MRQAFRMARCSSQGTLMQGRSSVLEIINVQTRRNEWKWAESLCETARRPPQKLATPDTRETAVTQYANPTA
jgi:hypothetical protein